MNAGTTHVRILSILVVMLIAGSVMAQINQYKEYTPASKELVYFTLSFNRDTIIFSSLQDSVVRTRVVPRSTIVIQNELITAGDLPLFDAEGVHIQDIVLPYDSIWDITAERLDGRTELAFTAKPGTSTAARTRRGNLLTYHEDIVIDTGSFIRGAVFTVLGDIQIQGEVNRNVVSLFGNVTVAPAATLRGDIVTVAGIVTAPKDATIYGEVFGAGKGGRGRKHRFMRSDEELQLTGAFRYNRVDGATPFLGIRFRDKDSLLPTIWLSGGFAFASNHGRIEGGVEQYVLRRTPVKIGLVGFRRLESGDDWLLSDNENLAYTLLATEDLKDYYEAKGGSIYAEVNPHPFITAGAGYVYEETNWLRAHRHLWSMFGGSKIFRENFSTVDSAYLAVGVKEIDTTANGSLYLTADYDSRARGNPWNLSAWALHAEFETGNDGLGSDYDYERARFSVARYQKVSTFLMLVGRGMYGYSQDHVPLFRQFFLGGLGTLYGLDHKEHRATDFVMGNFEARVDLPRTQLAFSLLFDAVEFDVNASSDDSDDRFPFHRSSLGGAIYYGDSFRFSVARPVDNSGDHDFRIYVRLAHHF